VVNSLGSCPGASPRIFSREVALQELAIYWSDSNPLSIYYLIGVI